MVERTKLAQPFAANGDKSDIAATGDFSLSSGFGKAYSADVQSGGKFVPRTGMNAILNAVSSHTVFEQQGGEETFDATYAAAIGGYEKGAVLWYSDPRTGFKTRIESQIDGNIYDPTANANFVDQKTDASGNVTEDGSVKWATKTANLQVVDDTASCTVAGVFYFVVGD